MQARKAILLPLAPAHVWRILREPDFRRVYPGYAAWLRRLLALEGLILAGLLVWAPAVFGAAVLALGGTALWLRWRGRAAYGTGRGLPRGPLDLLSPAALFDPEYYTAAARTHGVFFKCAELTRSQVCVSSLAVGRQVLSEHATSLHPLDLPFHRFIPGSFLRRMEEPTHGTYRRQFSAALSSRLVERWRDALGAAAARGLERLALASRSAGPEGAPPQPHVRDLVLEAWMGVFLGIAPAAPAMGRLRELFAVIDIRNQRESDASVLAALATIEAIMRESVKPAGAPSARGEIPDTCVLREVVERQPDALDDPTVARNLIYMLHTGAGDVSGLLTWILKFLSDEPIWIARLRSELSDLQGCRPPGGDDLASRIVAETLRLRQSEFVLREVTRPIRHRGLRIPGGWLLRISVQAGHRDPHVFENPDVFDPDRFLRKRPTRDEYSPFGLDRHACIGEGLARAMGEMFARELTRYAWEVTTDGPAQMSSWRHWEPSSRFRVRLALRAPASVSP
jgi:cytochrome P450